MHVYVYPLISINICMLYPCTKYSYVYPCVSISMNVRIYPYTYIQLYLCMSLYITLATGHPAPKAVQEPMVPLVSQMS